jgi:uncharacterized membrane protein YfcA
MLADLKRDRRLWIGGLISSWFWLVGAVALPLLQALAKTHIGGDEKLLTISLLIFTLGIAVGSAMAAQASKLRPNLALAIAALLIGVFCLTRLGGCRPRRRRQDHRRPVHRLAGPAIGFALFGLWRPAAVHRAVMRPELG